MFLDGFGEQGLGFVRKFEGREVLALFNLGGEDLVLPDAARRSGRIMLSSRDLKQGMLNDGKVPARTGVWIALD